MSDYYDQTPEQRRQLRAQRNRQRQAQVRRRKLLLGLLVLAVLAVVLILVLRGCGKDKEPAQPTPSENVDKPDTPNTPAEPSDREQNVRTQVSDLDYDTPPALNATVTMDRAWHIMREQRISAIPVVNEDGTLYGTLSAGDPYLIGGAADAPNDELFLLRLLHRLPPCVICWFLI